MRDLFVYQICSLGEEILLSTLPTCMVVVEEEEVVAGVVDVVVQLEREGGRRRVADVHFWPRSQV